MNSVAVKVNTHTAKSVKSVHVPAVLVFTMVRRRCSRSSGMSVHVAAEYAAEIYLERIERIIYLAAFMIPTGKRVAEYFRLDKDSLIAPYVEISKTGMWDRLNRKIFREGLYHDCNDEDNMLGTLLLGKEPLRPAIAKLRLTDDRYGRVPRSYIRLTEDRAVSISLQDKLLNETSVDRVESIHASHSAYFSKPDELVAKIISLSRA